MNLLLGKEILQLVAWTLALAEIILAVHILTLNVRNVAHRHVSVFMLLLAINSLAVGMMHEADLQRAGLSAYLMSATTMAIVGPMLFLTSLALLKTEWLQGRGRYAWWILYGLALLPAVLTVLDGALDTQLWYTGLDAATYTGEFMPLSEFTAGTLAPLIKALSLVILPVVTVTLLLYIALWDRGISPMTRRLARILLGAHLATFVIRLGLRNLLSPGIASLITHTIFTIAYAYAAYSQMLSRREARQGRLETRLIILIVEITVPLILVVMAAVDMRAEVLLTQNAEALLGAANRALSSSVSVWLDLNDNALQTLVKLPDIISMDPERQIPLLETMAETYPHISLISTTDWRGQNVARSDGRPPQNYFSESWQQAARNARPGDPLTVVVTVDEATGKPILVAARPIRRETGTIVGVAMFTSSIADIAPDVLVSSVGETGFAYVVDDQNRVVAHSDLAQVTEFQDLDTYPPVYALRGGARGVTPFIDDRGDRWQAYVDELDNGWGVIVQQAESELLSAMAQLRTVMLVITIVGVTILVFWPWVAIRQALRPIEQLTETAISIAGGNLARRVQVESEDEIGTLAQAFNSMTEQLQTVISNLEQRVADRTQALERRSAYLQAAAQVGHAAASILDPDQLIREAVELIRERFDLYYVGLFLVDETREWAVLQSGTGEAGQAMLARGHRIRIGEGMVGWSVANEQARVAHDVGRDAVRLSTSELPLTRSEAALPLISRGQAIGALTVQSDQPAAFDEETIVMLQTMTDQVAVALENARLFAKTQEAAEAERCAYGQVTREAWSELLRGRTEWGYRYAHGSVLPAQGEWKPELVKAATVGRSVQTNGADEPALVIPIKVRDQVVGALSFRKEKQVQETTWTVAEMALLNELTDQLGQALESARLFQETQRRAVRDRLVANITARVRSSMDPETILQTAVRELGAALGTDRAFVRLGSATPVQNTDQNESQENDDDPETGQYHEVE